MKILYAFLNLQFYFYFIRYLKEYDYYERCVRERQWQEKPPKVFKRHRNNSSSSGCLCFTGRSRSNDSKRAYRTVWISKVNFHSLKQFACYTTLSILSQLVWEDIFCHLSIVHFTWTLMFFVIMRFLKTGTIWLCQYSKWICFLKFLLKRGLFMSFRISKYPRAVVYLSLNIH